ncbi:MAG: GNAT family N-acetyltransferase [Rhodobacterales bacterium]|nr:GNAT family N-acetyltransferase [Rhodobacterales bacterium]
MYLTTRPLAPDTWPDFARLAEAHHGVWGGCWCMAFHARGPGWGVSADLNRAEKQALVQQGRAQAALVYAGADCLGWCQYGPPAELPRIKNLAAYRAAETPAADWRITCFFVEKSHRGQGIAQAALHGALAEIARLGGGRVEGFPEDTTGRKATAAFLFSGSLSMFKAAGFAALRQIGKHKWVVTRTVTAFP